MELNNIVVKNLSQEHGKRMIEAFKKLGVDTRHITGRNTEEDGKRCIYYGIIDNAVGSYDIVTVSHFKARVITLEELEAIIPEEELTTNDIEAAITLLKSIGYKVMKSTTNWQEI